jgi:hypothetical protein
MWCLNAHKSILSVFNVSMYEHFAPVVKKQPVMGTSDSPSLLHLLAVGT